MIRILSSFFAAFDKSDLYIVLAMLLFTAVAVWIARKPQRPGNWDHFWQNFDKILAVALFMGGLLFLLHLIHHGSDATSVQWAENLVGQIWSSIAILLGVAKAMQRQTDALASRDQNTVARTTTTVEVSGTSVNTLTPPVADGNEKPAQP